ncbi:hypothetical protein A3Q56_08433, partial [Intoshia linei]
MYLNISQKLKILKDINSVMKPSELSNKYEVSRSTNYYIKKNKLINSSKMSYVNFKERKNFRKFLYPKMEEASFYWKCSVDSLSADMSGVETFKEKILELSIEMGLNDSQIYNADETTFYCKKLDRSSLNHSNEHQIKGIKFDKSRLTAMACTYTDEDFVGIVNNNESVDDEELFEED